MRSIKLKVGQTVLDEQGRKFRVTKNDILVEGQDAPAKKIARVHGLNPKDVSMWADKLNVNLAKSISYLTTDNAKVGLVDSITNNKLSNNLDLTKVVNLNESIGLREGKEAYTLDLAYDTPEKLYLQFLDFLDAKYPEIITIGINSSAMQDKLYTLDNREADVENTRLDPKNLWHEFSKSRYNRESISSKTSIKEGFNPKWEDEAKEALEDKLDVEVKRSSDSWVEDYDGITFESTSGRGSNGESEWIVFKNYDDAERYAIARVRQDLEVEPEIFTPSWLENYIYISKTDIRIMAGEEADYYIGDMSDNEVLKEIGNDNDYEKIKDKIELATDNRDGLNEDDEDYKKEYLKADREVKDLEQDLEDLVSESRDTLISDRYDELVKAYEDPIQYFVEEQGTYSVSDLMSQSFINIDIEEASKDAVSEDGVAHFLDRYNGEEEELVGGFVAFGTN